MDSADDDPWKFLGIGDLDGSGFSGRFTADGRPVSKKEFQEGKAKSRVLSFERRMEYTRKSLWWLGHRLHLPTSFDLAGMLRQIHCNGSAELYYPPKVLVKPEGGERIIFTPKPELMMVQRRLHRLLMGTFRRNHNTFGHLGGSCREAVARHRTGVSMLKFDIQDAFGQVSWPQVRRAVQYSDRGRVFSRGVSYWITQLCVFQEPLEDGVPRSFLPQGAPTSPVCFHLACGPLDDKLTRIATRFGGTLTRFADNYYFSMPTAEISVKLRRIIINEARKKFPVHKIHTYSRGDVQRMLGYNITEEEIKNTRDYQRKLRGALYVLRTSLERGLEWEGAYARVKGLMGFSVNLPPSLQAAYEYCERLIDGDAPE